MIRRPLVDDGDALAAAAEAARVVEAGGVVLMPTETFYGIGADPRRAAAIDRVFRMKARPADHALPVVCSDWAQLEELVIVPDRFRVRLGRSWPGPLTVVLALRRELPASRSGTLAVRIPGHPLLRSVLYRTGPLTGTSANRHGRPPEVDPDAALRSLAGPPDLVLDGGRTAGGDATTVVDLTGDEARIVRQGGTCWEQPYPWQEPSHGS